MNLRDRRNLESAVKRLATAEKELIRARKVLEGVSRRTNDAAERDEKRKAAEAAKTAGKRGKRNGMKRG